ncbi:uncharacterized protein BDR25DRAFT_283035 [Lindgomyces ingoldianus]|uniref:Uncharacterized protein n=1 Tax=Lindgomyces ingoldianus TaxID=673940 RepID=A0ACB6R2I8_9PLEO|nr:uncharacterized protein BDR25DRAFT_283035 [Lindgomyces ingoldianus]KAF2473473.1 hypothetical protein BDR25DRAFT_283035 [Lindgomyces ingoldianus]
MIQLDVRVSHSWVVLVLGLVWYAYRKIRQKDRFQTTLPTAPPNKNATLSEDVYTQIEPLPNFNPETTEPIKIRPFKPKYHLTMALENTTLSDLVVIDSTYHSRISLRRQLIRDRPSDVLAANPIITPAVTEFYEWIMGTYLPRRFPTMFKLTLSPESIKPSGLQNLATDEIIPLTQSSAEQALKLIGSHIDDDFLFLLPTATGADSGKYKLEGFITCFPSGFNTAKKLNMKLADIHSPVPGYGDKLEKSMDRFFAGLPIGKIVKRVNWSITTTRELHVLEGTHLTQEQLAERQRQRENEEAGEGDEVNIANTVLRCERQTLHRLPRTKALVFAFKTYQYGMQELKDEGCGEELASAIDGLGLGSVPGMTVYKRQVVWGEKVKAFLRA